jgi:acyl-coenzyme A synthetase/AMP-(fatty) acid ligase/surface polysaccharide O-acyltransferase-like enzyme
VTAVPALRPARAHPQVADALLAGDPSAIALVASGEHVDRGRLRKRVETRAGDIDLPDRSVVILSGDGSLDHVVTYLALLHAGHVPLLCESVADSLSAAWPQASIVTVHGGLGVDRVADDPPPLHPDLALLMSTSGSTGSPKLVRLSRHNLLGNARAIADYLALGADDRGITSLPLHYCYGLSVLHSHLLAGAGVVLTGASVVDPCFADAMAEHGVTNLAGVPYTYELLERVGADRIRVPSLRLCTQAGGRMSPGDVTRWVERTDDWGVEFFVMYGQTEATARIAYLPPRLARRRPEAIGVAIPGGALRLRPVEGAPAGTGELMYAGPNVMMGYAVEADDLAAPAGEDELATGDLARFHADDGVFEIVGRRSRLIKPFGRRVDLDDVERRLDAGAVGAAVAGDDEHLVVVAPGADGHGVRDQVRRITGLTDARITVDTDEAVPRTASGKVDYAEILRRHPPVTGAAGDEDAGVADVAGIYATVLGLSDVDGRRSFVELGGDSMSYIECSLRLEAALGHIPTDWHLRPIEELSALAGTPTRTRIDTTVLYRAIGICLIVATHMRLWFWPGGAHLLLAVVGFNMARFTLPVEPTARRVMAGVRSVGRVAVPTMAWVAAGMVLFGAYSWGTLLLINNYVGPRTHRDDHWHFWFIEVFVQLVVVTTALLAIPAVRRAERRFPYLFPLVLLGVVLVLRLEPFQLGDFYNMRFRTHGVAWFFVLGWLVHRSTTREQKLLTTVLCLATAPGFFGYAPREFFIAGALVVLVWWRELPIPVRVVRPIGAVAAASMWIYITHFTFWPLFLDVTRIEVAYLLTIVSGVAVWFGVTQATRLGARVASTRARAGHDEVMVEPAAYAARR